MPFHSATGAPNSLTQSPLIIKTSVQSKIHQQYAPIKNSMQGKLNGVALTSGKAFEANLNQ
jgi:hypothetical protein